MKIQAAIARAPHAPLSIESLEMEDIRSVSTGPHQVFTRL